MRVAFNKGMKSQRYPFGRMENSRVVIPRNHSLETLKVCHDGPLAGHMGFKRTWKRAQDSFWWGDVKTDVKEYVDNCESCGVNKHSTLASQAPIQMTDIPTRGLEKLQIDFLGPFSVSQVHDYRYALQIQDVISRYVGCQQ